ncbi:receptor-like protein EIX1 [Rhododendron vialii]|uniref:receptor-like protein EIX1 n=1 Tax=Rhododendron vialii TaxID=182163 RepID=UPI00265F6497|nr:receptor-like protein EIX1 [Rhododendron vialii]
MMAVDISLIAVPKIFPLFLIIVTLSVSSSYGNLDVPCLESEKHALLSFKKGLADPSNRLSSWDVEADCCTWAGVVCDNLTGRVCELHLQNPYDANYTSQAEYEAYVKQKLGGEVNPSLLNLKHLNYLDLSRNDFGGIPIPTFLGSLTSLRYLNLSESGFAGTVPHQLGNLSSLRSLGLKGPNPYGLQGGVFKLDVENLDWLSRLSTLEYLDLSQVKLNKTPNWLQVINKLPSLVELRLSYCELDHMPPLEKVNFTSLAVLDLSRNEFHALMPRSGWIFSLGSLVSLNLAESNFEGSLPDMFWNLTSLRIFDASYNYLNSTLPNSLFSVNSLVSLNLRDNGFEGPIPSGLQNMTNLRELELSENFDFNSSIPNWIYSFRYLEVLDLHSTLLHGTLSSSIENLTSLVTLDIAHTKLRGRVPREMGNLCNLRTLRMSDNKVEGDISELFESLSGCISYTLVSLWCDGCQLSGHLTDQLEQFKSLKILYLGGNSLSGPIPVSLGRCSSLTALNLAGNQLNGTLPENFGHLSNLEQISLGHNLLEGVVSEVHFVNLTSLKEFYASGNKLVLKASPNWIPPFQLEALEFRSWHLGPQFPMWLHSQKGFWDMDLSGTGISDSVPQWFWNLSSRFSYLNLSHNQIQGKIPNIPKLDVSFSMIYLGSNQFSGPLPRLFSNVTELDLSNNLFSGEISNFLCERKDEPNRLKILHLGGNLLSGEIPDCWENWPNLEVIKLGNNHLSGNIPSSLGFLPRLESLHLRNNSLSGEVPLGLENCTQLVTMDLGLNLIVGSFPTWLGRSLSNLKILSLRSNYFDGQIPSELCHLSSLQILDLANNSFSGPIPQCLKNLTAMVMKHDSSDRISYSFYGGEFLENAFVVTKGREFQYNTILVLLTSMDLSDNNISGEIPEEITSLLGLRSLNLSGNHLRGVIPKEIGNMELLESLDLSRNQLSGELPQSMSDLTFLGHLNVSCNTLRGRIPSSTQLQSFNASSFIGNVLCGPPLTQNCSTNEAPPEGDDEEGAKSDFEWFYLTAALGFVIGFWLVVGPLLFKKSWWDTYSQFLDEVWKRIGNCLGRSF